MKLRHIALCSASVIALSALAACQSTPRATPNAAKGVLNVILDGDVTEWPETAAVGADEHFVYFRMSVENEEFTLQSAPESMVLMLDCDANRSTGRGTTDEPLDELGVDLEVRFSPIKDGKRRQGVEAHAVDASGATSRVNLSELDFMCAPTHSAGWYEVRIARTVLGSKLPPGGLLSQGALRGLWAIQDDSGEIVGYSDPFTVELSPAAANRRVFTADMPSKPEGALRVMTMNVENTSTIRKPQVFARIIQAINPDVVLMQEWDDGDGDTVQKWFTALVPREGGWNIAKAAGTKANGGGVLIATSLPMLSRVQPNTSEKSPAQLTNASGQSVSIDWPVRQVAALIDTPLGEMAVSSVHLKCCGSKGSSEDIKRTKEALFMSYFIGEVTKSPLTVIAGDMNLVGSRDPLSTFERGYYATSGRLTPIDAWVLGDTSMYTWSDDNSTFAPGRLDYILHNEAATQVVNAFVLDTSRLSVESLARLGLDAEDSRATDHRPVVVDLIAR